MDIPELGFLVVLALILFGPEELPTMARKLGGIIYDLKKASQEVQQEVRRSVINSSTSSTANNAAGRSDNAGETSATVESEPELIDFSKDTDPEVTAKIPQQEFPQDNRN